MRRLLLAAALLLASPAQAVDYVQCREMMRTKNELIQSAIRVQGDAYGAVATMKCGKPVLGLSADQYTTYETCIKDAHASYKKNLKPVAAPLAASANGLAEGILFDPEAIRWYKAAIKVASDMSKAGCPYQ